MKARQCRLTAVYGFAYLIYKYGCEVGRYIMKYLSYRPRASKLRVKGGKVSLKPIKQGLDKAQCQANRRK